MHQKIRTSDGGSDRGAKLKLQGEMNQEKLQNLKRRVSGENGTKNQVIGLKKDLKEFRQKEQKPRLRLKISLTGSSKEEPNPNQPKKGKEGRTIVQEAIHKNRISWSSIREFSEKNSG